MADPTASGPGSPAPPDSAPVVIRIILAILLGLPGIFGIVVIGIATGIWLSEGLTFLSGDRDFVPFFIVPASSLVVFSAVCIGIILRYARWRQAPAASLVLAIIACAALVVSYQLVADAIDPDDSDSRQLLMVGTVLGLVMACLPPLLHWWSAPLKPRTPAN